MLRDLSDRRQLGAYYTPSVVAEILCSWAITKPQSLVLEPSFGGCEFLDSSIRRLQEIGCEYPEKQIFGCDIDPFAFEHLSKRPRLLQDGHFLHRDFLQVQLADFNSGMFDVIIGNPPYVRHQNLDEIQRRRAREIRQSLLPNLNLQASLWGLFLLHSTRFLTDGGRFAWLLPSSFLYSDYSKALRRFMRRHFEELTVVKLDERLFEQQGATEGTIIVAAAGWQARGSRRLSPINEIVASSTLNLRAALFDSRLSSPSKQGIFEKLRRKSTRLGQYCSFQIGIVTGDADFFLFDKSRANKSRVSNRNLAYVVSRSSNVPGLLVTAEELRGAYERGERVKLFNPSTKLTLDAISYISRMARSSIEASRGK